MVHAFNVQFFPIVTVVINSTNNHVFNAFLDIILAPQKTALLVNNKDAKHAALSQLAQVPTMAII